MTADVIHIHAAPLSDDDFRLLVAALVDEWMQTHGFIDLTIEEAAEPELVSV